jgi:hypothetical protein
MVPWSNPGGQCSPHHGTEWATFCMTPLTTSHDRFRTLSSQLTSHLISDGRPVFGV